MPSTVELEIDTSVDTESKVKELFSKQYPGAKFISARLDLPKKKALVTYKSREELEEEKLRFTSQ
jgi:hypothetical protein